MLRSIFVIGLVIVGTYYALQGPFYALLFYIANAYFRPETWVWNDFVSQLNLSLISGCYLLIITLISGQKFFINQRVFYVFLFLVHTFLSAILSNDVAYSMRFWPDFFKSTIITYLMIILVQNFAQFRVVILVMVLALGLEGAKQGWVHILTSPAWPNTNKIPFLGDNNGVGIGMLMLVPIIGFLAQTASTKKARYFFWFLLIGVLFRALSTHSRGTFLSCIAVGVVYWFLSQKKIRMLAGFILIMAVTIPALPSTYWERMQTIRTYEDEKEASALSRLHFWKVAVAMGNANPLLGVGYNAYTRSYDTYDFSNGLYGHKRATHNSYFGLLADLGYPGIILFGIILGSSFLSLYRVRKWAQAYPNLLHLKQSASALGASLVAFSAGSVFLTYQYTEIVWHFIGLTIILERIARQSIIEVNMEYTQAKLATIAIQELSTSEC